MDLNQFVKNISDQFDEADTFEFKASTKFKLLEDWNSMVALSLIAIIDDEYGITIKGDDLKKSETIEDLYEIVQGYKSKN